MGNWYRVMDPLSPLCGSDVRGYVVDTVFGADHGLVIQALRRVDVFTGDRPFQLVAGPDEDLGLIVRTEQLQDSPLQDEVIELVTDRPHGRCLDEYELDRSDGVTLRVARFEQAVQVALDDAAGLLLASTTYSGDRFQERFDSFEEHFRDGVDEDDLVLSLRGVR